MVVLLAVDVVVEGEVEKEEEEEGGGEVEQEQGEDEPVAEEDGEVEEVMVVEEEDRRNLSIHHFVHLFSLKQQSCIDTYANLSLYNEIFHQSTIYPRGTF